MESIPLKKENGQLHDRAVRRPSILSPIVLSSLQPGKASEMATKTNNAADLPGGLNGKPWQVTQPLAGRSHSIAQPLAGIKRNR
jgi:hypothetical protein